MRRVFVISAAAIAALVPLAVQARAAERVSLRNGFDLRCDHHAQINDHMRLFLSAGEDNYIDLHADEIAGFETVPDLPAPVAAPERSAGAETAAQPAGAQTHPLKAAPDGRLAPEDLHEMLSKAGQEHNVDVDLLASLVKAESGGNARAVSRTGARGLMQLMPGTAAGLGVEDSFQPEQNVRGGTAYLDALLTRYKDNLALALAAYNAGPAAVDKYHGIPPYSETRAYVARVIHEFNRRVLAREALARQATRQTTAANESGSR
jgi:hypothetical protein